jgi:GTP pyrophosphokinase
MGNNSIKYPEYSKEDLINKVFEIENIFSDEEKNYIIDNFYKSLSFAEEKHKEQFRDSGEKYIEHLKRTLYNVFDLLGRCIPREYVSDLVVSSILHDVIEDTEITFQELEEEF